MNDTKSVNQVGSVLVEATKEEADITPTSGVSGINNKNEPIKTPRNYT